MTITLQAVNELIASLESAGELSIKERKYLELAKAYVQLAAENVALKAAIECHKAGFTVCEACGEENGSWNDDVCKALDDIPATDRIVAGIKDDGLPANIAEIIDSGDLETICYESERSYAEDFRLALYNFRQLREGAK
ncbi:TPA: hypothetical protein ACTW9H_004799 [Raoultella ornithinolytica]